MGNLIKSEKFERALELFTAIILGITAVLTAYASWQSSLYGGNQATKYTKGTALLGEANSMYNEAAQYIAQDMEVWNSISGLRIDKAFAESQGEAGTEDAERCEWKLDQIMADNVGDELAAAIEWADGQADYASPFDKEGFIESYYKEADAKYTEGEDMIEEGQKDNSLGDKLGLVTVIYAVVLFLLGVVGTFKNVSTRLVITVASVVALIFGAVLMLSVPMLTL